MELDIIAAVVIGGASLSGGVGSIFGSMIGALIMAVLRNGSNPMGWPTYVQEIIIGTVIIIAVGLEKLRQSRTWNLLTESVVRPSLGFDLCVALV